MLDKPLKPRPSMDEIARAQVIAEARSLRAQSKRLRERCARAVERSRRLADDFHARLLLDESLRERWLTSLAARRLAALRSSR
jgi:hypothetical protein